MSQHTGNTAPIAAHQPNTFSGKLRSVRSRFLQDVAAGEASTWTVVMGNESGDLDSIASSLAYWWFRQVVLKDVNSVPLVQTPRNDLKLRPENELALSMASLVPAHDDLLCIDDIPPSSPFPARTFALVDHNRLLSKFSVDNPGASVTAIIDHHEDEHLHLNAHPRIVRTPVGSASSLVAEYIKDNSTADTVLPPEVSTLLLSAILIDTGGLKPGGKGEEVDRVAASFLFPNSSYMYSRQFVPSRQRDSPANPEDIHDDPLIQGLFHDLADKKNDVTHLDASDLLKRDYKQYQWDLRTLSDPAYRKVDVGLSTVPLGLRSWLPRVGKTAFFDITRTYMSNLDLDMLGILTSFNDDKSKKHGKEGKHKRQLMLIFRSPLEQSNQASELAHLVVSSLQQTDSAKVLELEEKPATKYFGDGPDLDNWTSANGVNVSIALGTERLEVYLFRQKNAKATRKIVAPLLKEFIEGGGKPASLLS